MKRRTSKKGKAQNVNDRRTSCEQFTHKHRRTWDLTARRAQRRLRGNRYYHWRLQEIYRFLVEPGQRVLELGCGYGDLLAALSPGYGVGIDFSGEMVSRAAQRYPHLHFVQMNANDLALDETFDVIVLSDLVNDLWDVQAVLEKCRALCHPRTRIILNCFSRLWLPLLSLVRATGLANRVPEQSWVTVEDLENLLHLAGFDVIRHWSEMLWPMYTPLLGGFLNKFLVKTWPFRYAALTNFIIARPQPSAEAGRDAPLVSVIVPARNEAGNIRQILERTPEMGRGTEIIFVEGHSTDNTYEVIEKAIAEYPSRNCRLFRQGGTGKGDAVRLGFARAQGDILMVLDADLTVPPEDLPRFFKALVSGKGEFINGVRLVYPMEKRAMRFHNLVGNKFFSLAFSFLLGQNIKDTLCGTKVLWKRDYMRIEANRRHFGDFDPFGDFDLIFGAAKLNLKIVDMPIRYRERTYGKTNIQRWKHGWLLLRMVIFAARRIKFL